MLSLLCLSLYLKKDHVLSEQEKDCGNPAEGNCAFPLLSVTVFDCLS